MAVEPEEPIENPSQYPSEVIGESIEDQIEEPIEELSQDPCEESIEKPINESTEEPVDEPVRHPIIKHKKIAIGIAIFVCTILGIYFGLAIYFTGHYYFGSQINSIDVSGKTIEEAQAILMSRLQNYTLTLKERGGKTEQFKGEEIGLKYRSEDAFRNFKDSQKPLKWVAALFNKENSKMTVEVQYDEQLLKERIDQLSCFDSKQIIEPKIPKLNT